MSDVAVRSNPRAVPPFGLPPGDPTFAGFQWFVQYSMGIPLSSMPTPDYLQVAYDQAINLAYIGLAGVPSQPTTPSIYAFGVYNLGCAILLQFAQDDPAAQPPSTYWNDLRTRLGINNFVYGLITAAADQGTSDSLFIPDVIKSMTLWDLQLAKSPWGQQYLMFAGEWGSIWGITF
jgi:hypothetical protein